MKKFISYASLFALMLSLVGTVGLNTASATVSGGAVAGNSEADLIVSATNADYNVTFDTDQAATATTITVTFPAAFTITDGALTAAAVQSCNGTASNICVNGADVAVTGVAGSAAGKTIIPTIGVATNLSTGPGVSFRILTGVQNPAVAGTSGTFTITSNAVGEVAQAGIAGVLITPAAIANLVCLSGSPGSVYLRWATPLGATAAYTAKRSPATITDNATFNAATTITQAWATGNVGETQQQLVLGLTANQLYFFNIKAGGANASISPISNTALCNAPGAATGTGGTSDAKAPTSTITAPIANGGIQAGTPYTIKGTSSDTGGSSVKTVEVSIDGGTTWMTATPKTSTATGFDWEYVWSLPGVGTYTIKSRATDYVGNVETPSLGVTATVMTTLPSFTVDFGSVPGNKPVDPALQAQLDALIAQLKALQAGTSTQPVNLPPGILSKALTLAAGVGTKGNEVTVLQNFLKAQGSNIYPEGLVTGYFGPLTLKAVQKFQEKYGIAVSGDAGYGFVGPKTRAKINSLLEQ